MFGISLKDNRLSGLQFKTNRILLFLLIIGLIYEKLKYLLSLKIYIQTNLGHGKLPSVFVRTCACIGNSLIITFSFGEMKVFYKKEVGAGTAVKETPEIERVKKNQQNISSVSVININYSSVRKWWSNIFSILLPKILPFHLTLHSNITPL